MEFGSFSLFMLFLATIAILIALVACYMAARDLYSPLFQNISPLVQSTKEYLFAAAVIILIAMLLLFIFLILVAVGSVSHYIYIPLVLCLLLLMVAGVLVGISIHYLSILTPKDVNATAALTESIVTATAIVIAILALLIAFAGRVTPLK